MKSLQSLIATAYVASWLATTTSGPSSSSSISFFANAQEVITECNDVDKANCTATNQVCYNYEEGVTPRYECGYCLNGYFEYENECYLIKDITDEFVILTKLLELYLPDYVVDDPKITPQRVLRLIAVTKIISFWNSQVPPPQFELGLTMETFLTEEERKGRLGVDSSISYNAADFLSAAGNRGKMTKFALAGDKDDNDDDDEDEDEDEEGGGRMMRRLNGPNAPRAVLRNLQDVPASKDWEEEGYTTIIKNQGLCGSCWAVSTAAAVESALMITGQTPRYDTAGNNSLSFQQMISCDTKEYGCQGGNILQATRYVWEHDDFKNGNYGGLYSNADWPYSDRLGKTTGECDAQAMVDSGKKPAAYLNFPKVVNSVNDRANFEERRDRLKAAVAQQPVIAVLKSGCDLLMNYRKGVLTHDEGCQCCSVSCIDHAIAIVGYDTTGPTPYWKLRNSWGKGWGEDGYFKIAMNDPGCGWGLFGMLAESALPSDAYRNLEDLPERPGWWETSATWEKVMVILFSILGFCCLCGCLAGLWNKYRGGGDGE